MALTIVPQSVTPTVFTSLVAEIISFAALTNYGGGVKSWNSNGISIVTHGIVILRNIVRVVAGRHTFAPLCSNGSIVFGGNEEFSGEIPQKIVNLRYPSVLSRQWAQTAAWETPPQPLCVQITVWSHGVLLSAAGLCQTILIVTLRNIVSVIAGMNTFAALCAGGRVWAVDPVQPPLVLHRLYTA